MDYNMDLKFSNRVINFISRNLIDLHSRYVSFYVKYVICKLKGVDIGLGNKFYGMPYFYIANGGNIKIGSHNKFVSSTTLNKMGVHHKCMISATPGLSKDCTIEIGNYCGFSGTSIWCFDSIKIGNNVRCGANTLIMDGDAHFDDKRTSPPKPIIIEDNVFLGAGVIVRKGVRIGKNSVIGMNSMVTHDIPENVIAVGTPCRIIKSINR